MCIVPERRRRLIGMCQRGRPSKQKPCEFVWNEIATPLFLFPQSPWENSGELRHGKFSSSWRLGKAPSGSWERVQVTAFGAIMGSRRPGREFEQEWNLHKRDAAVEGRLSTSEIALTLSDESDEGRWVGSEIAMKVMQRLIMSRASGGCGDARFARGEGEWRVKSSGRLSGHCRKWIAMNHMGSWSPGGRGQNKVHLANGRWVYRYCRTCENEKWG